MMQKTRRQPSISNISLTLDITHHLFSCFLGARDTHIVIIPPFVMPIADIARSTYLIY